MVGHGIVWEYIVEEIKIVVILLYSIVEMEVNTGSEQCDNQSGCNNSICQWYTGSCANVGLYVSPTSGNVPLNVSV